MNKFIALVCCLVFTGCTSICDQQSTGVTLTGLPGSGVGETAEEPNQCLDCDYNCLLPCKNACPNDFNKSFCEAECRASCCYGLAEE